MTQGERATPRTDGGPDERTVDISVANASVDGALTAVAARAGWRPSSGRPQDRSVLVTDCVSARLAASPPGNATVLVCEPTAFGARAALDALSELLVAGIVCADQPNDLYEALRSFDSRRVCLPARVMELAAQMPSLTERQLEVLRAVAAGQTNSQIAAGMYISPASVKRDMAALYSILDADSRPTLMASAARLGVPPLRASP